MKKENRTKLPEKLIILIVALTLSFSLLGTDNKLNLKTSGFDLIVESKPSIERSNFVDHVFKLIDKIIK